MPIQRVTQNMIMDRSMAGMQKAMERLAKAQERLTTGRAINRPSDSPTGTTAAMRLRASLADLDQYKRNAQDGSGWLGTIDTTLTSSLRDVRRARDLGLQGVSGATGSAAREALAAEIDQIRKSLIAAGNTTYLGRPVFGGITAGDAAYDSSGSFVGEVGDVVRTVGKGVKVQVNVEGTDVFGPDGGNVFDTLEDLSVALRAANTADIQTCLTDLTTAQDRITSVLSDVGTRAARLDRSLDVAEDSILSQSTSLSDIENVDLAKATVDLQLQQVAYQAALGATAKVIQPSLLDFLR